MREFLLSIGVKEDDIESCIINEKGIFIPTYGEDGIITVTAEENYNECVKQIDICPEPTDKERITKLEEEKAILAENVYQLASILEVMLGGTESGQTTTTTTDTIN